MTFKQVESDMRRLAAEMEAGGRVFEGQRMRAMADSIAGQAGECSPSAVETLNAIRLVVRMERLLEAM